MMLQVWLMGAEGSFRQGGGGAGLPDLIGRHPDYWILGMSADKAIKDAKGQSSKCATVATL